MTVLYNVIYRAASGDGAHTSIDGLNRHVRADQLANVVGLKFGPDVSDLAETLSDSMSLLAFATDAILALFSVPQFAVESSDCVAKWKALGTPGDYRPPSRQPL